MPKFAFAPTPHTEASAFIRSKPAVVRAVIDAMLPELRARAFAITGLQNLSTVQQLRDLIAAIPEGADWDKTKADLQERLLKAGLFGDAEDAERAAAGRAELLLRTHVFQAYQAANYRVMTEEAAIFPYWKYVTVGDERVRDSHAALDQLILPANDPFWQTHFPPWDWGCRCQVLPMTREEVEGIKQEERDLPPERHTVIEGPRLERIRQGHLDRSLPADDPRGPGVGLAQRGRTRTWDVQSDDQRGREGALVWQPGSLAIPVNDLKAKYDPDLWSAFEASMRGVKVDELPGQPTVWDWMTKDQPAWKQKVADKTRQSAVSLIETGIRRRATGEVAVVVGPDGVNYAVKQVPGTTMELTRDELKQFAGKTGIHNHPSSSAFSPEDLRSFVNSEATEWRVVGQQTTFVLRRPPLGWTADALSVIDQLEKRYLAQSQRRLKSGNSRATTSKRAAFLISEAFAAKTGAAFVYQAEGL